MILKTFSHQKELIALFFHFQVATNRNNFILKKMYTKFITFLK